MLLRQIACVFLLSCALPSIGLAQSAAGDPARLSMELNEAQDVGGACRLTFLVRNGTGQSIDKGVFETVIFDKSGGVVSLSLFDFRALPADRPRVRQFELPNRTCDSVGQVLINGANSCLVNGTESDICDGALSLGSRLSVELLG